MLYPNYKKKKKTFSFQSLIFLIYSLLLLIIKLSKTLVTRSKNNIFKPKTVFAATKHDLKENLEPSIINQTLKIPHWREASSADFDALLKNGTWTLISKPENTNPVGCKWLFRIKRKPAGSVARYKTRLVSLPLDHGWSLHQMDVNHAFLQGNLTKDVYMQQPTQLHFQQLKWMLRYLK